MGFVKVKNFLCCITLESGGLIIGWVTAILSAIFLFLLIGVLSWATSVYNNYIPIDQNAETLALAVFVTVIIITSIYMIYHAILLVAAILLIRSTRKRDHTNMMFFMILMAIGVFISFIQLFSVGIAGLGFAVLMAGLDLYFFICVYSLYDLLRNESRGGNNQVRMQAQTVTIYNQEQQPVTYTQQQPVTYNQQQPVAYNQPPPNVYQQQQPVMFQPQLVVQSAAVPPSTETQNQQKIALY